MTGGKQHIGYYGDMPAIVSTFRNLPDAADESVIVAVVGTVEAAMQHFLVRNDAPKFSQRPGGGQMDGRQEVRARRTASAPTGSPRRRSSRRAYSRKTYLNQNIEVITTNFRAGKLDAAVIWEPTAAKIVQGGLGARGASGEDFDALDGGFLIMLNDLIKQRPDVHRAWLEAELDAQLFLADPQQCGRGLQAGGAADRADGPQGAVGLAVRRESEE